MRTELLTQTQIETIHTGALEILSTIGVHIPHENMLSRFADAGASVDPASQRVRIPAKVVEWAVEAAGKSFVLHGRDMNQTAAFGQGSRNYNSIAGEASWVDEIGGERRFPVMADVAAAARVADALPCINIVGAMADPHETPISWRCVQVLAELIRNTTKPVTMWFSDRASARFLIEIMIALRGDVKQATEFPICYPFLEPISPLRFPHDGIDLLYETARLNLPVPIGPMAQMGVSAPMSIAGVMAQEHAEILAGICVTQLVQENMPVCYGGICHAFDMSTTQMIFCGPEQALFGVGMTQMGKSLGVPVYVNVGLSDSKRPDAQAGLEAGVTLAQAAAAGADIFGHMGICGVDQAASLDMLVFQNEVISYVESTMREVDCSDEALGLDTIRDVVAGASFLESDHTAERFRQELWFPSLLDRQYYQAWRESDAKSCEERCREQKNSILANHKVEPVSPELDKAMNEIVEAAQKELG